jgi:hypothetical protein
LRLAQLGQPRRRILAVDLSPHLKSEIFKFEILPAPKPFILSAAKDLNAANHLHPFPLPQRLR